MTEIEAKALRVGDRVRATRALTAGPTEELPAQHFCNEGDSLVVRKVGAGGHWPIYVSHPWIEDRSFGVALNEIREATA